MRPGGDGAKFDFARRLSPSTLAGRCAAAIAVVIFTSLWCLRSPAALAQSPQENIALKSGESVVIGSLFYVASCKSILIAPLEVEILEGPPELTLSIKEDMVLPRRFNCPAKVPGGTLTATATAVKEPIHTKLTYRVKYRTKDGDRQIAHVFNVELFP